MEVMSVCAERISLTHFAPIWVNAPILPPRHAGTSDKAPYINKQTLFVRSGSLSRHEVVLEGMFLMHTAHRQEGAIYERVLSL